MTQRMKTALLWLVSCLLMSNSGEAATYHVDTAQGSDAFVGNGPATAWKTLGHACKHIEAGDTVVVHPGVYYESVDLEVTGTAERPIRLSADGVARNRVVITGASREFREGWGVWAIEDGRNHISSTKISRRPLCVLAEEADLFPYATLEELTALTFKNGVPGPEHGFAYDEKAGKLYVRLPKKAGSHDPAKHVIKMAVPGAAGAASRQPDRAHNHNVGVLGAGPAHVILEGLTFETPGLCGVYVNGGQVTVRDCWFVGCRAGVVGRSDGKSSDDVVIERCDFSQEPAFSDVEEMVARARVLLPQDGRPVRLPPYYWSVRSGGPDTYEYGIALYAGARWKILGNYIHDCVDGLSHASLGEARDAEIAFNTFERIVDDAIETGDHCGGLRAHHNFMADVFAPLSWDPKGGVPWPGPITFDHNVVISTLRGGKLWAALPVTLGCFELKCGDDNWTQPNMKDVPTSPVKIPEPGMLAYHNTIILPLADFFTFTGLRFRKIEGARFLNNIVVTRGFTPERYHDAADLSGMEFDGNLVAPGMKELKGPGPRLAGHGGKVLDDAAALGLADPLRRNFGLREKGPALGGGVTAQELPALSKDIGAYPRGAEGQHAAAGPRLAPPAAPLEPAPTSRPPAALDQPR